MIDSLLGIFKSKDTELNQILKRVLNILFVSGITSFLFRAFYFDYVLINLLDPRAYYKFFINGDFIIPISIFGCVWYGTIFISYLFFRVPTFIIGVETRNWILSLSLPNEKAKEIENRVDKIVGDSSRSFYLELFENLKKGISYKDLQLINHRARRLQGKLEEDFSILVRGTIAICFYFINLPHFGKILFTILLFASAFIGVLMYIQHILYETIPVVIHRGITEIESYLKKEENKIE